MKKWISAIVLVVFVTTFSYSGYQLYRIFSGYHKAEVEYDGLVEQYVTWNGSETESVSEAAQDADTEQAPISGPVLEIDFDTLSAVNPDVVGWIYMENCNINYPIVRGTDNEFYLSRTFEKQVNSCGSIFMDAYNIPDFYDYNTFLYGHNMKNGSMFGGLKKLYQEEGYCDLDPYFYIFLPTGERLKFRIFSYYLAKDTSDSYQLVGSDEEYEEYIKKVKSRSAYPSKLDATEYEEAIKDKSVLVTLSTCSGPSNSNRRFLVHGVYVSE